MRPPRIAFTLVAVLLAKLASSAIAICLLGAPVPARSAANDRLALETGDHATLDAYIQAGMRAARIPGRALGVVRGDQIVYLKGYGVAGPDGRAVTPQTPFILGSTSKPRWAAVAATANASIPTRSGGVWSSIDSSSTNDATAFGRSQ